MAISIILHLLVAQPQFVVVEVPSVFDEIKRHECHQHVKYAIVHKQTHENRCNPVILLILLQVDIMPDADGDFHHNEEEGNEVEEEIVSEDSVLVCIHFMLQLLCLR